MSDPLVLDPLRLPFAAKLSLPGSKSHSNRALVLAALSPGSTAVTGLNPCDDVKHMATGLQALGWELNWTSTTSVQIGTRNQQIKEATIFCGNAGTAVRFLSAVAATLEGTWVIAGDSHMQQRPVADLVTALQSLGATIECSTGCPPLTITGGSLAGGTVELDASKSSQFLSALLLISPVLPNGLEVKLSRPLTSPPYVKLTCQCLKDFKVAVTASELSYTISATTALSAPASYPVEGDWSAVGTWLTLADLSHSHLDALNLKSDSLQGDRLLPSALKKLQQSGELTIDCTNFPDQLMNLAVASAHRPGLTHLTGAANLRHKECNRLAVITSELKKVGIDITEDDDGVTINGYNRDLKPAPLDPHDDHRLAMAFAILASLHPGLTIQNPECVAKTYSEFWQHLEQLKTTPRCLTLIGMRASGKTTLAKHLADELKLEFKDTDEIFEQTIGPINDFVATHGWSRFRSEEATIVQNCLAPGRVVALGGGAIEDAATRQRLQREATSIWLDATADLIAQHLQANPTNHRPPLTNQMDEIAEIKTVLATRNPLYKTVADIHIPVTVDYNQRVPFVLQALQDLCSW